MRLNEQQQMRLMVAAAMAHGMLANPKRPMRKPDDLAHDAYAVADALLSTMEAAVDEPGK
jgi:hypothetical protein